MIRQPIAIPTKYSFPLLLALIIAGLAGNYFKYRIFLNIDFLFVSIFAMLALQFLGLGRGIVAAAIIASYTYILWNHPYAIIIQTAEVAVVGWLITRRKIGMVLADTLFWLIIGMPLVYLFYHTVMHVPPSNSYIVMTKQAVNGIANALVARLIFTAYALRSRTSMMSYKEIIYNLLAFFVLIPALLMLAISSRNDFAKTDRHIRTALIQDSMRVTNIVDAWVLNRKTAILNLAEMAASRSPQQMQTYLEQAKKSDINFLRIGLHDREATTTAFFPLIDELGQSNIGKIFADRPFIPTLKRTLKPMLSEVIIRKLGARKPGVLMLAPVVISGEYSGYIAGTLSLEQIQNTLDKSTIDNTALYTMVDKNNNVIMTNRTDQKVMTPFVRNKGTLSRLDKGISQWVPTVPLNTPVSERWRKSLYVEESTVGDLAEWKLILEQPVAPFQEILYDEYTGKLTLLFLILLGALALSELLSRKIVGTLGQLRALTHELPRKLATGCKETVWPESGITETNHLINNFREMADSLSKQFTDTININKSLEWWVQERTGQLDVINTELSAEITERKQVEIELREAKTVAEAANKAKSQFLATMSHEIRTPLSSMLGNIELLEGSPLSSDQQACLRDCKTASQMLLQVINDVLDFSKIESGKLELVNDTFSISSMGRQLLRMLSAAAKQKGLELTISLADDLPEYIRCDQQRLRQIISNLLSNAIKFTLHGRVSLEISCEQTFQKQPHPHPNLPFMPQRLLEGEGIKGLNATAFLPPLQGEGRGGDGVCLLHILVTDTGIGIPVDKHDHIFNSFTQVEDFSTRNVGGTGLGLTICRRLLALMGGSITVVSVPGEGSVFTVILPVDVCPAQEQAPAPAQSQSQAPSRNILLADDEEFGRTVAQKLLERKGYKVTAVKNGAELLDALQKDTFEIVLTDISMPVMDGTTVARIIRSGERDGIDPHIPIIAMTAHAFAEDRERYMATGINGYVTKPIDLEDLYSQIEHLCGNKSDTGEQAICI